MTQITVKIWLLCIYADVKRNTIDPVIWHFAGGGEIWSRNANFRVIHIFMFRFVHLTIVHLARLSYISFVDFEQGRAAPNQEAPQRRLFSFCPLLRKNESRHLSLSRSLSLPPSLPVKECSLSLRRLEK